MAKILIVDDEDKIRSMVRKYAEYEGHEVMEAANGIEAVSLCTTDDFDVILMDVMMPQLDGFAACRQIRKYKDIPVIMLSARGEEYDRIQGFEYGVDDYVVKPFSPRELMLRVNVVVSRHKKNTEKAPYAAESADAGEGRSLVPADHEVYVRGGLVVDFTGREVYVDNEKKDLTYKEYELLTYFIRNKGIALSREQILTEIWGYDYFGDDRTLDTHIKMLRSRLGQYRDYIVTLRGVGYRFDGK